MEAKANNSGEEEKLDEVRPQKKQKLIDNFFESKESDKTAHLDNIISKAIKLSISLHKLYAARKTDLKETPESRANEYHSVAKSVIDQSRNLRELIEGAGHIVTINEQQKSYVCAICARAFECYQLHRGCRALRFDRPISNKITGRGHHLQSNDTEKSRLFSLITQEKAKNPN